MANLAPLSVASQLLWPLATTKYGGRRPQIGFFVTSIVLWPSSTTNSGGLAAAKVATKLAKISPIGNADLRRIEQDDVPWHSLSDPVARAAVVTSTIGNNSW